MGRNRNVDVGQTRRKRPSVNDIDLARWREYEEIETDSLWLIPERDRSGEHIGDYHGNFVPQIPRQAMLRYTKHGDVVLDGFLGSGTTLIECRRMGRHGIGVELKPDLADSARERIEVEENLHGYPTTVITGDTCDGADVVPKIETALEAISRDTVQLVILHPPYHSIIRFSDLPNDLSNAPDTGDFLVRFGQTVDNTARFLESGRYLVLVIGDMYVAKQWVPLGFYCMQEVMSRGFTLKSIVVKDMRNNRAKRQLENIWRYRALAGGFYIFKHEYVVFFEKRI
ncbi:MAG: DNA methylase [Armatimonadetes bacterium]|nr:DNA methylase [Armatimonadota bacterium]